MLELGAGRESWLRALLRFVPEGELRTVDSRDVTLRLQPAHYDGRLMCHRIVDKSFDCGADGYFDFFWSFGLPCHSETSLTGEILVNPRQEIKPGAFAVHQYGEWGMRDAFESVRARAPESFMALPDGEIWWSLSCAEASRLAPRL